MHPQQQQQQLQQQQQQQQQKSVFRSKCIVLGSPAVGKSALVQVFHSDGTQYPKNYNMTVHTEVCVKVVYIPDSPSSVELFIYDIAGHDVFLEYVPKYAEGASTFILVFDVTNQESFHALPRLLQIAKKARNGKSMHGILVANKIDLATRRLISSQQGEEFAKINKLAYFECSALNNTEVDAPFYYASNWFYDHFETAVKGFIKAGDA